MADAAEFMSEAWVSDLERVAQRLLDESTEATSAFTYVEWFTDPPAPRADGKRVGYVLSMAAGTVTVRSGVDLSEAADCTVQMTYDDAAATMQLASGPALGALSAKAFAAGTLVVTGSLAGIPIPMNALHDELCGHSEADVGGR